MARQAAKGNMLAQFFKPIFGSWASAFFLLFLSCFCERPVLSDDH
jgi:hypothetical protein